MNTIMDSADHTTKHYCKHNLAITKAMSNSMSALAALVLCLCVVLASASSPSTDNLQDGRGKPLAQAFSKPLNVDSNLDCAIRKLALDYAGDLLVNVSL